MHTKTFALALLVVLVCAAAGVCARAPRRGMPNHAPTSVLAPDAARASKDCNDPDCWKTTAQLIESKGYPSETHTVTTEDGYELTVFRIPPKQPGAPVILLQHGLEDCSNTWVYNFPSQSLGFLASDAGFDVWMGNVRGNEYALKHRTLSPKSSKFWDFSFDEMAQFDLPAMIDYALAQSGAAKLTYVGHSQGTRIGFQHFATAGAAAADKVHFFAALSPIVYLGKLTVPAFRALADIRTAELLMLLGDKEFLPHTSFLDHLVPGICDLDPLACEQWLCSFMGCNKNDWNATRFDVYFSMDPAGTSTQNMAHYTQGIRSDKFNAYDYGPIDNLIHYGHVDPPEYALGDIAVPTGLYVGAIDDLADPVDVQRIRDEMRAGTIVQDITVPGYTHLDPVWGLHANKMIYAPLLKLAKQYAEAAE